MNLTDFFEHSPIQGAIICGVGVIYLASVTRTAYQYYFMRTDLSTTLKDKGQFVPGNDGSYDGLHMRESINKDVHERLH